VWFALGCAACTASAADPSPKAQVPPRLELTFTGDLMFGGYFDDHYDPQVVEKNDPLVDMDAALVSDLPFGNLETTITRTLPNGGMGHQGKGNKRFVTLPERVAILTKHHFALVTLTNNHQNDNDVLGLTETPKILDELGLKYVGAARTEAPKFRVETVDVKGWRIGIIPATTELNIGQGAKAPMIAYAKETELKKELVPLVEQARKTHDLVFVVVHWGVQYQDVPAAWQVDAAHAFIDAGADAVIGHHPHHLQAIERYKAGVIAYSLGNFVFPNAKDVIRQTGVLRVGFAKKAPTCIDLLAFHPAVQIRPPITHPIPAKGKDLEMVAKRFFALSAAKPFATTWTLDGERFIAPTGCPK
jgi:poly-gamma-glutamate capsule biosynthesis protein CapA/YwtB (metallophosphatase superfamily)